MKKYTFLFILIFVSGFQGVYAHEGHEHNASTSPTVSIGVGNNNIPENSEPIHNSIYTVGDEITIFATVSDDDLDNYHFRIIKDGSIDGYTCEEEGALFAVENQGYASTTLGKDACGFVYNQSVYVEPMGFTNKLISIISAKDLIEYSGEGDYWLIIGARDVEGNRSNSNYLNDTRIKITLLNSTQTTDPQPNNVSSGDVGNGPIVNTYGVSNIIYQSPKTASNTNSNLSSTEVLFESQKTISVSDNKENFVSAVNYVSFENSTTSVPEIDNDVSSSLVNDQFAQVLSSGLHIKWFIWAFGVFLLGVIAFYFLRNKFVNKD